MPVARQGWRNRQNQRTSGPRVGWRSGLEERNGKLLEAGGHKFTFEKVKIEYLIPATSHTYTPDFELENGIIVETKGKFEPTDRAKHLYIKMQHPDLDIRFVFQRPTDKIGPNSHTTLAQWAEKHGFKWAAGTIPDAWLREPVRPGERGPRTIQLSQETKDKFSGFLGKPNAAIRGKPRGGS